MTLSDEDQKKVDKLNKRLAKTYSRSAEEVVERTIGDIVLSLLGERASITLDGLKGVLESRLEATPSARGKGSPDLDIERQRFLAALRRLDEIQAPGQTSDPRE